MISIQFFFNFKVVKALVGLPDGGLASGSWDSTIKIWTPKYAELKRTLTGHTSGVLCLSMTSHGDLISASADKTIKIWHLEKGELKNTLKGHTDSIWVIILISNDELASCGADSTIKIWSKNESLSSLSQVSSLTSGSLALESAANSAR